MKDSVKILCQNNNLQTMSTLFYDAQLFRKKSGTFQNCERLCKKHNFIEIEDVPTEDISNNNLKQRADYVDSFFFRFGFVAMLLVSEKVKVTFPKWFCPQ